MHFETESLNVSALRKQRMEKKRSRKRQQAWTKWAAALFLLVLIPSLVFGPVLGDNTLLLHSHGEGSPHVHVVGDEVAAHPDRLEDAHDLQHHHEESQELHDAHHESHVDIHNQPKNREQRSHGIFIKFLIDKLGKPVHSSSLASVVFVASLTFVAPWQLNFDRTTYLRSSCIVERSPPFANRSGIAALLRTSRAILI
ncbi:MAG: hypothetical protein ACKVS6_15910 [Planctomycetota bacterium]